MVGADVPVITAQSEPPIGQNYDTIASRLDALPPSGWHRRMVVLIGLGGFFNLFEVALGSFFGVLLSAHWSLNTTDLAMIIGSVFVGEMIGSLVLAPRADRLGRRTLFQINLVAYAALSVATAFSPNLAVFLVLRLLTGVGLGAELTLVDTYLSELLPSAGRGRYMAWSYTLGMLAVPVAGVLAKLAAGTIFGLAGWRWLLIVAALGGIAVWLIRRGLPESPRWLAATGKVAEADRVLTEIESQVNGEVAKRTGQQAGNQAEQDLEAPAGTEKSAGQAEPSVAASVEPQQYRRRAALMWVIQLFGSVGFYGFASIGPIVLLAKGFDVSHSLSYSALAACGYPLGSLLSVFLAERVERRTLLIVSSLGVAAFGLVFGFASAMGLILVAGFGTTLCSVVQSNVSHIYQAELFRSANRSTAIGIPYSASRLVGAVLPLATLTLLHTIGAGGLYTYCGALLVFMAITVRVLGPRTNSRQLDTL